MSIDEEEVGNKNKKEDHCTPLCTTAPQLWEVQSADVGAVGQGAVLPGVRLSAGVLPILLSVPDLLSVLSLSPTRWVQDLCRVPDYQ